MIAITGATGFIGRYLIPLIDAEIVVPVRSEKISQQFANYPNVNCVPCDYSEGALAEIWSGYNVQSLIHLAGVRPICGESYQVYRKNIALNSTVFDSCRNSGITDITYISSRSVYGRESAIPTKEDVLLEPCEEYGLAKKQGEDYLRCVAQKTGIRQKTLRLSPVFGMGDRSTGFMSEIIDKVLDGGTLKLYGKGQGRHEYLYVKDAAEAIYRFSKYDGSGVFNLGAARNYSLGEVVEIAQNLNPEIQVEQYPERYADESVYLMDSSKAYQALGWRPEYSLKSALQDIQNLKKH